MSAFLRCGVCKGTKNAVGLGGIVKKCINCKGVGYVGEPESKPAPESPKVLCAHCKKDVDWANDLEKVVNEASAELEDKEELKALEPGIYQGKKKGPKPKVLTV